jgi:hypothetical protein
MGLFTILKSQMGLKQKTGKCHMNAERAFSFPEEKALFF